MLRKKKANTSIIVFLFDHTGDLTHAQSYWKRVC